jgi:hypothetical protein
MIRYCGSQRTVPVNSNERITILKRKPPYFNLNFDSGYAAMEAIITCPAVAATLTKMLLKMYLEKGTHIFDASLKSMKKLLVVGLLTKNLGGKRNNSSNGLKEFMIE